MRKTLLMLSAAATALVPVAASAQAARNLPVRYVQEAQQQHQGVVQEFGGAETGARAAYVDQVGRRMAVQSGVNPQAFRFTTLNSAVENAFAVPGGYIYITRQLMALMNNEAELAFVVGHEGRQRALPAELLRAEGQAPPADPAGAGVRRRGAAAQHLCGIHVRSVRGIEAHRAETNHRPRPAGRCRSQRFRTAPATMAPTEPRPPEKDP